MKADLYERWWVAAVALMLVFFFGTLANAAIRHGFHPPSHVETIDPRGVFQSPEFREQGIKVGPQGQVDVTIVGLMFTWMPGELVLPAATPITFHLTSVDVIHGFEVVRSNGQTMVIPGYVSQFTTQFQPGEYLIACNEYCGLGHHQMAGKLRVVAREEWQRGRATGGQEGGGHAAH